MSFLSIEEEERRIETLRGLMRRVQNGEFDHLNLKEYMAMVWAVGELVELRISVTKTKQK